MVGEDRVTMSGTELRRVHVIRQVMDKRLTQVKAGALLGLTTRQVRRLLARVRHEGDRGLVHRARGRPSNRRIAEPVKAKILRLYTPRYGDFGPTLAAEKLAERHGIVISDETLRVWLHAQGIAHFQRRKRPHRVWRARKAHVGELIRLDGSHHDWFEGRGPRCVLMAYSDDASSRVFARFYEYEGTWPAMESFTRYVQRYGIPLAVYTDKHTTSRSPAEPTIEEQLRGAAPTSRFGRALGELGVELIPAHSPQAKGRVERLVKTFQDRLIKEMRLAGVATLDEANRFLEDSLPVYNRRFAVQPAQATDLHRPIPAGCQLEAILCIKTARGVRNDHTVAHHGRLYQIDDRLGSRTVLVVERRDGSIQLMAGATPLRYHEIDSRPVRVENLAQPGRRRRRPPKPAATHPWRKAILRQTEQRVAATTT